MRRMMILMLGLVSWMGTGVLWAQALVWEQIMPHFLFQEEIKLAIDSKNLERFENWESPEVPILPEKWREPILRPYFEQTHPAQRSDAAWAVSSFAQSDWYAYSCQKLSEGGIALVLLNEDKAGPYLLMLTFAPQGTFQQSLLLYADYQSQGSIERCRSNWADSTTLIVAHMSAWTSEEMPKPREETILEAYRIDGKGRLVPEPLHPSAAQKP